MEIMDLEVNEMLNLVYVIKKASEYVGVENLKSYFGSSSFHVGRQK